MSQLAGPARKLFVDWARHLQRFYVTKIPKPKFRNFLTDDDKQHILILISSYHLTYYVFFYRHRTIGVRKSILTRTLAEDLIYCKKVTILYIIRAVRSNIGHFNFQALRRGNPALKSLRKSQILDLPIMVYISASHAES